MTDVVYVTRHTYMKLAGTYIKPSDQISIDIIFEAIFKKSLASILNKKEALKLYALQQMLAGTISSFASPKKFISNLYVFKINPPKFHYVNDCAFLTSDFKNYLVPPVIKALGPDKVAEFQDYCADVKWDYEEKSADIFWAQVGARFHVSINPQTVEYENSGFQDVAKMTVDHLRAQIDESFSQCLAMLESEDYGKVLNQFKYAPHVDKALHNVSDTKLKESVREFFKLKRSIVDMLFELYKKESSKLDYILPVDLMTSIGLEACKGCIFFRKVSA